MNIESTSTATKLTEASKTSSSSTQTNESTSFKEEMEAVKAQETQNTEKTENAQNEKAQKTSEENASQQVEKNKLTAEKEQTAENLEQQKVADSLKELNSKIASLNDFKSGFNKTQSLEKTDDKSINNDYCQTIKMNNEDVTFFLNLVENNKMTALVSQSVNSSQNNNFTDIKTNATQSTVQVSATLLNSLNEAAKTGKPLRIDFDNDVAVIMKVDKDGVLSANFIPGSAAVESYLRNNIASLRQNFEEQNLPYNELTYSNQQKQEQKEQSKNKKENENE